MSRFDLFFVLVDDCNEVTDYAIARRIVDLHSRKSQAVQRVYSMVSHMGLCMLTWYSYLLSPIRKMFNSTCCFLGVSSPRSARPVLITWWRSTRGCGKGTVQVSRGVCPSLK